LLQALKQKVKGLENIPAFFAAFCIIILLLLLQIAGIVTFHSISDSSIIGLWDIIPFKASFFTNSNKNYH
jgi:hypothetical protein